MSASLAEIVASGHQGLGNRSQVQPLKQQTTSAYKQVFTKDSKGQQMVVEFGKKPTANKESTAADDLCQANQLIS
jgi:hypothetical protein